jgi:hypothetical protein
MTIMDIDGSNKHSVPNSFGGGGYTDWQPIPVNYPRPRGATPIKAPLVPAFKQCTNPNRTHGAPLSFGSCHPPQQASSYLTVGTPESNDLAAGMIGSVRYRAVVGNSATPANEADLKIEVSVTGVLRQGTLAPYGGQLSAEVGIRITDRNNIPHPGGPGPATVQDIPAFRVTVPCVGGTCSVATSANALMPGAVLEGMRAIWQLGQVQVYDGGADEVASTTADNTLFLVQGVFIP